MPRKPTGAQVAVGLPQIPEELNDVVSLQKIFH